MLYASSSDLNLWLARELAGEPVQIATENADLVDELKRDSRLPVTRHANNEEEGGITKRTATDNQAYERARQCGVLVADKKSHSSASRRHYRVWGSHERQAASLNGSNSDMLAVLSPSFMGCLCGSFSAAHTAAIE